MNATRKALETGPLRNLGTDLREGVVVCLAVSAIFLQTGCAYFKPTRSEMAYWQEQEEILKEQESRGLLGALMRCGLETAGTFLNGTKW